MCYFCGTGTAKDLDESFYYVKKAAEMGVVPALSNLADFYEHGWGTVQNLEIAEKLRAEYNEKIKNL